MNTRDMSDDFDDEGESDLGDDDEPSRATLLESEAAELRERLDALLERIGRPSRPTGAQLARRYAPALIASAVASAGVFAFLTRRRRRRLAAWARLTSLL